LDIEIKVGHPTGRPTTKKGRENMKNIQLWFLMLFLLSVTTACQPASKEYQPANDSLFKITFSYPASWNWKEDTSYDEPPPFEIPPLSERIILENGPISIQVYKPSDPQAKMQEWMDGYLSAVTTTMLHADNTVQVDGYNARWLTVIYPPQATNESQLQESIYLLVQDRFYIIGLSIPESEKGGRFYKEFEELIKTVKILP